MTDKTDRSTRPKALPVIVDNIPQTLKALPQWLGWRWEWRADKEDGDKGAWTKPPVNLCTGGYGRSTKPDTWCDFETAVRVLQDTRRGFALDGIGFALQPSSGIVGIDWDKAIDQETGEVNPDTIKAIQVMDTYAERSPSGTGYRAFILAQLPPTERRSGDIEIYNSGRYLTVTGHRIDGTQDDIMPRQEQIDAYHAEVFREKLAMRKKSYSKGHSGDLGSLTLSDREALAMARKAKNGHQFARLFDHGDLSAYGDDHSSADLALCNMLAFWCGGDETQIDRLFRESALYREKWDRPDYRTRTIELALLGRTVFYTKQVPAKRSSHGRGSGVASVALQDDDSPPDQGDTGENDGATDTLDEGDGDQDQLPRIEVKLRQLRDITEDALNALEEANHPPEVFVSNNTLIRLERDDNRRLRVASLGVDSMTGILARKATWVKDDYKDVPPPSNVVRDILSLGHWTQFPTLRGIVTSPILTRDNKLVTAPGFDTDSGIYYDDIGEPIPNGPLNPITFDEARKLIFDEMLGDFPFKDEASKANAVALMLLPILRSAINGPCPMTVIDAPVAGTGKSLLAEIILLLYSPGGVPTRSCPPQDDDAEWKKTITSAIMAKSQFFFLDNVKGALYNPSLLSAITTTSWSDRILGSKDQIEMQHSMIFVATSNNISMDSELSRRMIWVRLDANDEHPEQRSGFRHANIRLWTLENRKRILAALLLIVRAWIEGGCNPSPWPLPSLGSFESYVDTVGAVMGYAMPGFLGNREKQKAATNDEGPWHAFVGEWSEIYCLRSVGTGDLIELARKHLPDVIGDKSELSQKNRLTKSLSHNKDRVFGRFKIIDAGMGVSYFGTPNTRTYRLEEI